MTSTCDPGHWASFALRVCFVICPSVDALTGLRQISKTVWATCRGVAVFTGSFTLFLHGMTLTVYQTSRISFALCTVHNINLARYQHFEQNGFPWLSAILAMEMWVAIAQVMDAPGVSIGREGANCMQTRWHFQ